MHCTGQSLHVSAVCALGLKSLVSPVLASSGSEERHLMGNGSYIVDSYRIFYSNPFRLFGFLSVGEMTVLNLIPLEVLKYVPAVPAVPLFCV